MRSASLDPLGYKIGRRAPRGEEGGEAGGPGEMIASASSRSDAVRIALIEEHTVFRKLGLVIVRRQHRVCSSAAVTAHGEGENPNTLVMTATPIPRTLAMTVYGDLDLSVIDQMPPGF